MKAGKLSAEIWDALSFEERAQCCTDMAQDALTKAQQMSHGEFRNQHLKLAEQWTALAATLQKLAARGN